MLLLAFAFLVFLLTFVSRPGAARADTIDWGTPYIGLNNIWGPPFESNLFVLPEHNNMPVSYGWMGAGRTSPTQRP